MNRLYRPQKIYIERAALNLAGTGQILSRLPDVSIEEIDSIRPLIETLRKNPDPIGEGKRYLFLAEDRGRAFKPFPTPEGTLSCNFYSLHLIEGCDLECSYCILQTYLTNPLLTVYVNVEEILDGLESYLKSNPNQSFRIGTGQLADSLSLDHLTAHTKSLVPFFAKQTNAVLELKTKSINVDRLQKLDPKGRTIVSWSMNTHRIQREEEHKCSSIQERIEAARCVIEWGYRVGFHFDPLIDYEGCLEEYEQVIDEIFSLIPQEKVAWVSLGSLRFMPELKSIMEKRFPRSLLPYGEWVRGTDGKMRYFKEKRIEMYTRLLARLRELAPKVPNYLCMETKEVWGRSAVGSPDLSFIRTQLDEITKGV